MQDYKSQKWRYESEWLNNISLVLTGAAFYHKVSVVYMCVKWGVYVCVCVCVCVYPCVYICACVFGHHLLYVCVNVT